MSYIERDMAITIAMVAYFVYYLSKLRTAKFRKDFGDWIALRDPFAHKFHKNHPDLIVAFFIIFAMILFLPT